ncbi:MAG: phosphotransferase [Propionibacteriaceae bacterium]|jgi:maltokinase|nr:phosphotransferase [Propionibacteriaceae bacterium]
MPIAELWLERLPQARWFQSKGFPIQGVDIEPLPWYAADSAGWVRSELAHVGLPDGTATYHLLVGYLPRGAAEPDALVGRVAVGDVPGLDSSALGESVDVVDAPSSPTAMRLFLAGLVDAPGAAWLAGPPAADSPSRVFTGEQSNTNVAIGDSTLLKVFRKVAPGRNLEAEVLRDLAGSGVAPALQGTLSTADGSYDLALCCELVRGAADGWEYAKLACRQGRPMAAEARELGRSLKSLHAALARVYPSATIPAEQVRDAMLARLADACDELPQLRPLADGLARTLRFAAPHLPVQRVHGDFHLGQALVSGAALGPAPTAETANSRTSEPTESTESTESTAATGRPRWKIIDFEGEPLKTAEERRAPDSVWRDVAGLTRSIDYARSFHADPSSAQARAWADQTRAAFLEGYGASADDHPELLAAYETDKAVYELLYETRNRPDWADIPYQALVRLADGG